jgi:hypothetical protein
MLKEKDLFHLKTSFLLKKTDFLAQICAFSVRDHQPLNSLSPLPNHIRNQLKLSIFSLSLHIHAMTVQNWIVETHE